MKNLSYKTFSAIISIILILLASIIILTIDKGSDISKDVQKDDEGPERHLPAGIAPDGD